MLERKKVSDSGGRQERVREDNRGKQEKVRKKEDGWIYSV